MRKVLLYIAASLDGYIARSNGDTSWLHDESFALKGEDFGYSDFISTIDTTLMGNKTYQVVLGFDMPFPYSDKKNYVFCRSAAKQQDTESIQFVREDAIAFVRNLKFQQGQDIWLIGGSQINTLLLNAGLIDEIILTITPTILGTGIPLFAAGAEEQNLKVLDSKSYKNGFTQARYKCQKI